MDISLSSLFNSPLMLFFLKAATLLILFLYAIFALMIVRQVQLMGRTLLSSINPIISIMAWLHLLFVLGLIAMAWLIL